MPIHDWTRVDAGTWHGFHFGWVAAIDRALNCGVLPDGYYADPERSALPVARAFEFVEDDEPADQPPPRFSVVRRAGFAAEYAAKAHHVAIRREVDDRLVAQIQLASPGYKLRPSSVDAYADEVAHSVVAGVHVAVLDLLPPGRHDRPGGLAGAVAEACGFGPLEPPAGKPLWIASIEVADVPNLYAEPLAVGDELPDLPVYLRPGLWVAVPLAATYAAAWEATPKRWRRVIEGGD